MTLNPVRLFRRGDRPDDANIMDRSPINEPVSDSIREYARKGFADAHAWATNKEPSPIVQPMQTFNSQVQPKPEPAMPVPGVPRETQASAVPSTGPITPSATPSAAQQDYERLRSRGSGIHNIKNPILRTLATIGDVAAGTFAPRAEMLIPGTEGNYAMQLGRAEDAVDQEQGGIQKQAQQRLTNAQAADYEAKPELNQAKNELAATKQQQVAEHQRLSDTLAQQKQASTEEMAKANLRNKLLSMGMDENGDPLPEDRLPEAVKLQRARSEALSAGTEIDRAELELKQALAENSPEKAMIAQIKLQQAQQRLNIASQRLGLSGRQFEFRSQGTVGGVAPEGTIVSERGIPVGTANAANVRPTATEVGRADLAVSAKEQLDTMKAIVKRRPDLFGPGAGRVTKFTEWIGSQDPEAQQYVTARRILADHASGVFGARSAQAAAALEAASGQFQFNPEANLKAMTQIEQAMKTIEQKGTRRTVGSSSTTPKPKKVWNPATGRFE